MSTLLLLALVLATPQDEKFVQRTAKDVYLSAVRELNKAADLIADDPGSAVEKVTTILSNSKIKHFECRLKIEVASSEHEYHTFFPYQVRGKARMALAKKAIPATAENILLSAIEDLKTSTDRKVPGSAELLKDAQAALTKARADIEAAKEKDDPLSLFKPKFNDHLNYDRYRSALSYLKGAEGAKLTDEQRTELVTEVEDKCRDFRDTRINRFRTALSETSMRALQDLSDAAFNRTFSSTIPADSEMTEKATQDPTLVWIRRHMKTLKAVQAGQGKVEELLGAAGEALKLDAPEAEGDNPWFQSMALLASELCEKAITSNTGKAAGLPKDQRTPLQAEADKVHGQWKEFVEKTDKKVLERHPNVATCTDRLSELVKAFPVELAELASYDIDSAFNGDLEPALTKIENGLIELDSNLSGRVAIESRQELYTKLITAGALRRLIKGESEDKVFQDLRTYRDKLKSAGGPRDAEKYGPRVKSVFDRILRS